MFLCFFCDVFVIFISVKVKKLSTQLTSFTLSCDHQVNENIYIFKNCLYTRNVVN